MLKALGTSASANRLVGPAAAWLGLSKTHAATPLLPLPQTPSWVSTAMRRASVRRGCCPRTGWGR